MPPAPSFDPPLPERTSARSIAVAGCGPCGLATALLLARQGERVTLFERFAAPRPIGSGLMIQPTGLAVLRQLGLAGAAIDHGARIDRLHGTAGPRVVLDVAYAALKGRGTLFGIGLHRASLFAMLHEAVSAQGIEVRPGHRITGSHMTPAGRCLTLAEQAPSEPFDLIVDALGSRSALAPSCGRQLDYGALWGTLDWPGALPLARDTLSQRYRRSSTMAGVLPIGMAGGARQKAAFFWSLKASDHARWQDRGLARWKAEVRDLWPELESLLEKIVEPAQLTFARYAHRTLPEPAEAAMLHIGDAWHSASPQLGQGANMALLDAWALAMALRRHASIPAALRDAVNLRRRHVAIYQWLTRLFTPVYQSDSRVLPLLRDRLVGPLSQYWPATTIQAAMVAGLVADPLPRLGLEAG